MPISTPKVLQPQYGGDTEHFKHVLDHLFTPAIEEAGFEPIPPVSEGAELIHASIIQRLVESDFVLCDMSALNPNVFFELGIRTALNKPICLVRDDITDSVPFDTNVINHHSYRSALNPWEITSDIQQLSQHLKETTKLSGGENGMWKYFGLSATAHALSTEQAGDDVKYLSIQMEALRNQVAELTSSTSKVQRSKPSYGYLPAVFTFAKNLGAKTLGGRDGGKDSISTMDIESGTLSDEDKQAVIQYASDEQGISLEINERKI